MYHENADILSGIQWLTAQDSRVCTQCQGLEGQVWGINDTFIKHPVSDTHPMCRCSLIPVLRDNGVTEQGEPIQIVPDTMPPTSSFWDWALGYGLGLLLEDFEGRQLDSTRIDYDDTIDT